VSPEVPGQAWNTSAKTRRACTEDRFRKAGFFIGSGVIEAGCRTVIGQRLKKSGMFSSEPGAQNVIDLRCAFLGGHFDADWQRLAQAQSRLSGNFGVAHPFLAIVNLSTSLLVRKGPESQSHTSSRAALDAWAIP
jgi:hypothetical protein